MLGRSLHEWRSKHEPLIVDLLAPNEDAGPPGFAYIPARVEAALAPVSGDR